MSGDIFLRTGTSSASTRSAVTSSSSARVTTSTLDTVGARKGDTLSLSFNVDPSWVHREIVGQGGTLSPAL